VKPEDTRTYKIGRAIGPAAIIFWIVQVTLGVPSFFTIVALLINQKAEGALFTISLFLAWIGATIAIGVGSMIHGSSELAFPAVVPVHAVSSNRKLCRPAMKADTRAFRISKWMAARSKFLRTRARKPIRTGRHSLTLSARHNQADLRPERPARLGFLGRHGGGRAFHLELVEAHGQIVAEPFCKSTGAVRNPDGAMQLIRVRA
jgi:hypothetical protein